MRRIILCLFIILTTKVTAQTEIEDGSYSINFDITPISILGKTNVSTFDCDYVPDASLTSNFCLERSNEHFQVINHKKMSLEILKFDCGIKLMTKEFRELLDYKHNSSIYIQFTGLERDVVEKEKAYVHLILTIGELSNPQEFKAEVKKLSDGKYELSGLGEFSILDYNLEPPQKMMGMVKVKDKISIDFTIHISKEEFAN
ncbi:YceI family protein [Flammeovirga yaeyamensis]|uniref:YceI family protein n=1 Tax=Flammeovirga yaeyamensis TaxID=367791 RepID=A0AAX1N3R0_9BACT|nr:MULTISPECIES: YceI family protein [Flammeovirga]ANQ50355.1 YceI family protein [Flammeovirga sp. MY04]MBB3699689.1 hypothetical protein [Flammeovirga yaeyamensis]NMF36741.1 YceI family protein [Flammeovirga yaeyamensis]QWG02218.1 YceI family protein [Flammeovirga yaeyamensis]